MRKMTRRILSFTVAFALLVTCALAGMVLPVSANANLLVNGDFEQGNASWGTDAAATIAEGLGKDGSSGLKIETTVEEGGSSVWPGPYYKGEFGAILEANTTYLFSFDYKHEGKGFAKIDIVNGVGSDWTGWADVSLSAAADWTHKVIEFTTGAEENMIRNKTGWEWKPENVHYGNAANYGTGAAYFDNFSLIKKPDPATAIALDKTAAEVEVGKNITLNAVAVPEGYTLPTITWASDNTAVATVVDGVVTGVAQGTATITATGAGLNSVSCEVTVIPSSNLLTNGDFEDGSTNWATNEEGVSIGADVGKDGTGGMLIETTIEEGATAHKQPGSYYQGEFNAMLKPNTTYLFSFDYKNEGQGFGQIAVVTKGSDWTGWANSSSYTATNWTSVVIEFTTGAAENMSVNQRYEWKARRVHYSNKVGSGKTWFDNFKLIEKPAPATAITLDKTTAEVEVDRTTTLTAKPVPSYNLLPDITWTSDNEAVATVANGVVTGVAEGTATITATAAGLAPVSCTVTVVPRNNIIDNGDFEQGGAFWGNTTKAQAGAGKNGSYGLVLSDTSTTYYKGVFEKYLKPSTTYIFSMDYLKTDASSSARLWTSSMGLTVYADDLKVSDEWQSVTVTFTTPETITFRTGWEFSLPCSDVGEAPIVVDNLKLVKQPDPATAIALDKTEAEVEVGKTMTLTALPVPAGNLMPEVITWTTGNANIATVENGVVTGVKEGTVIITATAEGLAPVTCAVTVIPSSNLMVNGDFENGNESWEESDAVEIAVGNGKDGSSGLKIETVIEADATAHQQPGIYYHGDFYALLEPNTTYVFSFDYKNEGQGFGQINVVNKGSDWTGWVTTDLSATSWTHQVIEFTTGAAENMIVKKPYEWKARRVHYTNKVGTGTTWFDNFKLVKKPANATAIALDKTSVELEAGSTATLTVRPIPDGASMSAVTWTTDNAAVATVENGVVTAVTDGTATITASMDGVESVSCTVTVKPKSNMMVNGDFENGSTNWGSDETGVSFGAGFGKDGTSGLKIETTIEEGAESHKQPGSYYKGEFYGMLEPNTTYVFSFDYKNEGEGFGQIDIVSNPTGWTGDWADMSLTATQWTSKSILFTTGDADGMNTHTGYEWKARRVHYKANVGSGTTYYDNFKLTKLVYADALTIAPAEVTLNPAENAILSATASPDGSYTGTITWASSNPSAISVNENGLVTAIKAYGTATITATTATGVFATATVTINEEANLVMNGDFEQGDVNWGNTGKVQAGVGKNGSYGLVLSDTSTVYYKGDFSNYLQPNTTYQFTMDYLKTAEDSQARLWTSSMGLTVAVSDLKVSDEWQSISVLFTTPEDLTFRQGWEFSFPCAAAGTTPIVLDNVSIAKYTKGAPPTSITLSKSELKLAPAETETLEVFAQPVSGDLSGMTWATDNAAVATVVNGVVTAVAEGTATITATSKNGKTATCTVTVANIGGNLVDNGDFENGAENWDNTSKVQAGVGKDGSYGIVLSDTTTQYYKGSFIGLLEPATTYVFSIDYLKTDADSAVRVWSSLGFQTSVTDFTTGSEWQTYTLKFTTPSDWTAKTGWELSFVTQTVGTTPMVFDNVSLTKYHSDIQAESILIGHSAATIIPGGKFELTVNSQPLYADLADMVWTSDNENVATVNHGVVTGVGAGTATITATTNNGKSATCVITVSGDAALITDGSFDTDDHAAWEINADNAIVAGAGYNGSTAGVLVKGLTLTQTFTGLKPNTTYQFAVRYASANGNTAPAVLLQNGDVVLLEETFTKSKIWKDATYEFTTGAAVEAETVVTFTTADSGVAYVDNVLLTEKATAIDLIVSDLVWDTDSQVAVGGKVNFAVTVTNQGTDDVPAGEVVSVDLRHNGTVFQTLTRTLSAALAAGESITMVSATPWTAVAGNWTISAVVNSDLSILESNSVNNTKQGFVNVTDSALQAPTQAEALGMSELVFSDEFDSYDSIDMYATGNDGYKWYVTRSWNYGTILPDSYTVENGTIRLHKQLGGANITLSTMDSATGTGWDYRFGYLETRLRIVNPDHTQFDEGYENGVPAIWSVPREKWLETPGKNTKWVEMDWLEYWGLDTERWPQYPDGYYTTTIHDTAKNASGDTEQWYSNSNAFCNGLGDGEWHVMGWSWTTNQVVSYIDGVEVFRVEYSEDGVPSCGINAHDGVEEFTGVFSQMNVQDMILFISGSSYCPLDLDYVRIWQAPSTEAFPEDDSIVDSGMCGEDATWRLDDTGHLMINGTGTIDESAFASNTDIVSVTIGDGITNIDAYAFYDCMMIEKVELPDTLVTIGEAAFAGCFSLVDVTVPASVTEIGVDVFVDSSDLVLKVTKDSYAHTYAEENGIPFELVGAWATGIAVETLPNKTEYFVGDSFDATGLVLQMLYSDGTVTTFDGEYTVSGFDSTTAGEKTVTVACGDFTTTFTVTVNEPTLVGIAVQTAPNKTEYSYGEALNTDGLTLLLTFENGKTVTIADGFTVSGYNATTSGQQIVSVMYGSFKATFTVTVGEAALIGIAVQTAPTKTEYELGEALDTAGLKLTLTYESGKTETITEGYTVSGFDAAVVGEQTVTVLYEGFTATFTVTVKGITYGDVNADGTVDNKDVGELMRYLNGWDIAVNENVCDVNGDGAVNNKDLVVLVRYLNGWDITLG